MRKMKLNYNSSGDKTELYLTYINYEENSVEVIEKDYLMKDFDYMSLYNTIIDDLDAEYDDTLADMIDYVVSKITKNYTVSKVTNYKKGGE